MIVSFKDKKTQAVAKGQAVKGFPSNLIKSAARKLTILHYAKVLEDLRAAAGQPAGKVARPSVRSALDPDQ